MDEMARKRVDICIIEFNTTANLVQWFTPISQMPVVNLRATGVTAMGEEVSLPQLPVNARRADPARDVSDW